jgi:hypothetical protein
MLVHAKSPRGVLYLNQFQIWGKETGRQPYDIPFALYNACKDGLQDATYREGILSRLFSKPFPEVAFTYSELRYLPEITLDRIGPLMVDDYNVAWSHKKKIDQIKRSLAEVSPL